MKKRMVLGLLLLAGIVQAQVLVGDYDNTFYNNAERMLNTDGKLQVGGYAGIHYNQGFGEDSHQSGKLDVHRLVMMFGYNFNEKTKFVSEVEFEHVKELYVEQAFLQHKLHDYVNLRAGLMLTPMGIVNEYHEPTSFLGVERPSVDKYIAPTTWREIGIGFSGIVIPATIKYQVYLMNGFLGYNGTANLDGKNGLRGGRQKGAESQINVPNLATRVEFFGLKGLNVGASGYFGKTQSSLYSGTAKDDEVGLAQIDSSTVGVNMIGLDARYTLGGLLLRGQFYYNALTGTGTYNAFAGSDLGSAMLGYYAEAGYDVLQHKPKMEVELIPFVRYEHFNTQQQVEDATLQNNAYSRSVITIGADWRLAKGAVFKIDMQLANNAADANYSKTFNAGFGVMF